nr:tryptophan--tRNA ligase [uncultured Cohaesibacter sp.]
MASFEPRVFSGIQPSGNLHLGNYLGAITKFVDLQASYNCIFSVVDMHAITVTQDPEGLMRRTREVTAGFLASGIDPEKHIVFNQSRVSAHAELGWIFNCVARMGWLSRMTQFKDKAGKNRDNVSTGLFVYPNLMSADILIYKATHVPVGEDQKQHVELCRDTAQKFNVDYAERIAALGYGVDNEGRNETTDPEKVFFPLTEPLIGGPAPRVMSLRDGSKKMSSSDASDKARINLTDDAETISLKIRKAKTDPAALPSELDGLAGRPEASNLVGIYAALSGKSKEDVLREFGGAEFSTFKPALVDLSVEKLSPITEEMRRLMDDPGHIDAVLAKGAEKARAIANPILDQVKDIVGFIHS